METDKWKEDFLLEITKRNIAEVLADSTEIKIIGLPFYNEKNKQKEFTDALKKLYYSLEE